MFGNLFGNDDGKDGSAAVAAVVGGKVHLRQPPEPRNETNLMGLNNQGATCYLNALLQSMFMTPELRNAIFRMDPNELGLSLVSVHDLTARHSYR